MVVLVLAVALVALRPTPSVNLWGQGIEPTRFSLHWWGSCWWFVLLPLSEGKMNQTGTGVITAVQDRIGPIVALFFTLSIHKLLTWEQTCPLQCLSVCSLGSYWNTATHNCGTSVGLHHYSFQCLLGADGHPRNRDI